MKLRDLVLVSASFVLLAVVQHGESTLMLTSMLLAAKTGMLVGKMGVGGLMMMLMAASNQNNHNNAAAYGKKRTIRSADGQQDNTEQIETEEILVRKRLVRQMDSAFDAMTCLPKFVCGINAQTPSKKTSLMNDYGHLLRVIMLPEALNDDDDSDELIQLDDDDAKLVEDERDKLEDLAHDSLIDDDPAMLPFVLKEVFKKSNKKKGSNRNGLRNTNTPDNSYPNPTYHQHRPQQQRPGFSPLSSITSFLPTIEAGLGTKNRDSDFDNDPFFAGFKRSLSSSVRNLEAHGMKEDSVSLIENTETEEENSQPMTRRARGSFIRRMSTKLSKVTDPVEKYKIAEEVGTKLKTQDACTKVFKKCPYKWEEVMGMVGNLRNVITAHPMVEAIMADPNKTASTTNTGDHVVYLKNTNGASSQGMVTIKTNPRPMNPEGMTTVMHDLGNGNMLHISMKVMNPVPVKTNPATPIETKEDSVPVVQNETEIASSTEPVSAESQLSVAALAYQNKNANGTWTKKVKTKPLLLPVLLDDPSPPEFVDDEREDFHIPLRLKPDMMKPREPVVPDKTVKRKVGSNNRDTTAEEDLDEEDEDADADADEDEDEGSEDDDIEDEQRSRAQQEKGFQSIPSAYQRGRPTAELRRQVATMMKPKNKPEQPARRRAPIPVEQANRRRTGNYRRNPKSEPVPVIETNPNVEQAEIIM